MEYLKHTTEKTQGTKEKHNTSPKSGKSNSSHSGPALKGATLEMIKMRRRRKKKRKTNLKNNKKKNENSNGKKNKHRKKKNKQKKQNKLKRILILCLLKKMKRRCVWKRSLWYSQTLLSVTISLKAHCQDYQ